MATGDHLMVVALDFGTTYSGYAFSTRHEFEADPLRIHANQAWNSGGKAFLSLKTPTCLLLDDKKQLVAFGYDAENRYADIVMDGEQDDYHYFHRFKMNLHNNKNITSEMVIEDVSGKKKALAVEVFGLSIQALVNHLMDLLKTQGVGVKIDEIQWVLTIPAIWTDSAKQFMRKSGEKAGIPPNRLILALEPEAASIFCQYLSTEHLFGVDHGFTVANTGTKYMVVDLGGGTADITVHEKLENGKLRELCRATGNDCGGTSVDGAFFQMLVRILGGPLITALKEEEPSAYLDLFREFETVKRTISPSKSGKVNVTIPYVALDKMCQRILGEDLPSVIESSTYSKEIHLRGDKMRIKVETMKNLFQPTIDNIISLMTEVLKKPEAEEVNTLLLVGGFSDCLLIRELVKNAFCDKTIIMPEEAGLSVLKGAVLFGHRPDYVQSRVMRYTYGLGNCPLFDPKQHDRKRMCVVEGEEHCSNVFLKIVEIGQEVTSGTKFPVAFSTIFKRQGLISISFYVSTSKNPMYTDEDGCSFLGSANIEFEDPSDDGRWVDIEIIFGNSEISMTAVDRNSGKTISATFNLL